VALVAGFVLFVVLDPPWGAIALVAGATLEIGEAYGWYRYLGRIRVRTGAEGLVGQSAIASEDCRPRGRVRVAGEIWNATCPERGGVAAGERAIIRGVEGLTLEVERDPDQSPR
jgi:membrane-bound serine protease (ClpP class)